MAALNFGVILGNLVSLDRLGQGRVALRDDFLVNWEDHPLCLVQDTKDHSAEMMKGAAVVTRCVLIESPEALRVMPKPRG